MSYRELIQTRFGDRVTDSTMLDDITALLSDTAQQSRARCARLVRLQARASYITVVSNELERAAAAIERLPAQELSDAT